MKAKSYVLIVLAITLAVITTVNAPRIPSTTTVPPISAQSAGVIFQCSPFLAIPGSVVPGSSGFIVVQCPTSGALFLDGTLTPTFTLGIGYIQAGIILANAVGGNPCAFNFHSNFVTYPLGSLLNRTLTFSSNPIGNQMISSFYDYCLQYTNAPSTGLAGFDIIWT